MHVQNTRRVSANDEFRIENEELCIKNETLCIENEECCITNDGLCSSASSTDLFFIRLIATLMMCENHELCIKNEKLCIENTQKRGIVYQNHTKTRNFVL